MKRRGFIRSLAAPVLAQPLLSAAAPQAATLTRWEQSAANIGIAACVLFTAWGTLTLNGGKLWNLGRFNFPWHDYMVGVLGHVVLMGAGLAASFVFPNRNAVSKALTFWGYQSRKELSAGVGWHDEKRRDESRRGGQECLRHGGDDTE